MVVVVLASAVLSAKLPICFSVAETTVGGAVVAAGDNSSSSEGFPDDMRSQMFPDSCEAGLARNSRWMASR